MLSAPMVYRLLIPVGAEMSTIMAKRYNVMMTTPLAGMTYYTGGRSNEL